MANDSDVLKQAMNFRKILTGILLSGVVSSEIEVERVHGESPSLSLARLLEYSTCTREHAKALRTMWGMVPQTNPIITSDSLAEHSPDVMADIVYQQEEGKKEIFYLAARHTEPIRLAMNGECVVVSIMQNNVSMEDLWRAGYFMLKNNIETGLGGIAPSEVYPERCMLLQFWFSPKKLCGEDINRLIGGSDISKKCRKFDREFIWNRLRHYRFVYDGSAIAESYRLMDTKNNPHFIKYANAAEARGLCSFSIVEIGTTQVGPARYYIYTGSERVEQIPGTITKGG